MRNIDIQLFLRYVCMPFVVTLFMVAGSGKCVAQINTDQVMNIGRNALYFEDYILSIQYFNQVIKAKPYLADPYFYRAIAKLELEDYKGAEEDCSLAIERNPFIIDAYQVRGIARQVLKDYKGAIADYDEGLNQMPEHQVFLMNKAVCECEVGEYAEADSTYARLISIYPNYANAYLGRAQLRLEQKDTVSAISDIDKTIMLEILALVASVPFVTMAESDCVPPVVKPILFVKSEVPFVTTIPPSVVEDVLVKTIFPVVASIFACMPIPELFIFCII